MLRGGLRHLAAWVALTAVLPAAAAAQDEADGAVIDRIVAVVGTRAVLQSQVEEQLFVLLTNRNGPKPATRADTAALRHDIISDIIDNELLLQEAKRDTSIKVTEQEIADAVEQRVKQTRQSFATDMEWRTELRRAGFGTPEEYRRWLGDQQREEFLRNRLVDKRKQSGKMKSVPPTEQEMLAFFEQQKGRLGRRPATVTYRQIVVAPKPSREAKDSVMKLADSLVLALRSGADFATTARQWSQDPGSRELGGSLGWARRGVWVPAFERVAFAMRPGFVSSPVESPFGVHIIQVERVQPGEVSARHILLIPTLTQDSITAARRTADEVRAALAAGAAFDSLAKAHHDPSEQREFGESAVDRLAEPYKTLLAEAKPGEVPAVAEVEVGPVTKYVVVQVVNRRDDGETRFEDVKDQVREQLGQQLGVRRYLDALRSASYVEIRAT